MRGHLELVLRVLHRVKLTDGTVLAALLVRIVCTPCCVFMILTTSLAAASNGRGGSRRCSI
jgi:hypothetical protein